MTDSPATPARAAETQAAADRGDCIFPRCVLERDRPVHCGTCAHRSAPFDAEWPGEAETEEVTTCKCGHPITMNPAKGKPFRCGQCGRSNDV